MKTDDFDFDLPKELIALLGISLVVIIIGLFL